MCREKTQMKQLVELEVPEDFEVAAVGFKEMAAKVQVVVWREIILLGVHPTAPLQH